MQLAGIIASFHESFILHKDIKLENIMIDSDAFNQIVVKIGDFGTSFRSLEDKKNNN
jgi:serine/threonine protein kinase